MEVFIPSNDLHDRFELRDIRNLAIDDGEGSRVFGFQGSGEHNVSEDGGCYGYIVAGAVVMRFGASEIRVSSGMWFSTMSGWSALAPGSVNAVVFQKVGHKGVDAAGVLSGSGDLKYIDGCRDSVLAPPRVFGMPCLNALYAPSSVHQTMHTHPSTRIGVIVSAHQATCETTIGTHVLSKGAVFFLPKQGRHKFRTGPDGHIDLIAYHPDSDFGPTDEIHPMLNRTEVQIDGRNVPFQAARK